MCEKIAEGICQKGNTDRYPLLLLFYHLPTSTIRKETNFIQMEVDIRPDLVVQDNPIFKGQIETGKPFAVFPLFHIPVEPTVIQLPHNPADLFRSHTGMNVVQHSFTLHKGSHRASRLSRPEDCCYY